MDDRLEIINIDKNYKAKESSIIALGNFDGIHLAHRKILEELVSISKEKGSKSSILMFKNHTKNIINQKKQILLSSNKQKINLLKDIGIDIVYEIEFDETVMNMSAEDFINKLLIESLKVQGIVVGFDYRFGHKAVGNIDLLKKISSNKDIILKIVNKVELDNKIISSSLIRQLIKDGEIKEANKFLGYSYAIEGKVIHGKKLGSKMGFPTANIEPITDYVIPKYGVYYSKIKINDSLYKAATNIGKNPTVENSGIRIESNIIDFSGDIYGRKVELILLEYLRPELTFNNIDDLFSQIEKDIDTIKNKID